MILPIYVYGQPVLRKVAEDITPDYPNLKELIGNMFDTMHRAEGVGLAAPQIGLSIRVVVISLDVLSDEYPEYKDSMLVHEKNNEIEDFSKYENYNEFTSYLAERENENLNIITDIEQIKSNLKLGFHHYNH